MIGDTRKKLLMALVLFVETVFKRRYMTISVAGMLPRSRCVTSGFWHTGEV
jgi:hypothetical protein